MHKDFKSRWLGGASPATWFVPLYVVSNKALYSTLILMPLRLIACWSQSFIGSFYSAGFGLVLDGLAVNNYVHTTLSYHPIILSMVVRFWIFHRPRRTRCVLTIDCCPFGRYGRTVLVSFMVWLIRRDTWSLQIPSPYSWKVSDIEMSRPKHHTGRKCVSS